MCSEPSPSGAGGLGRLGSGVVVVVHPVLDAAASIDTALKGVAAVNPSFMTTTEKQDALVALARLEGRVAELKLRVLADASDVVTSPAGGKPAGRGTAARDAAAWLAATTRGDRRQASREQGLAVALDRRWHLLAEAVRDGHVNLAQAHVIASCLDGLCRQPVADHVTTPEALVLAEKTLISYADRFDPQALNRIGRRILETIAPEVAEEAEAKRLADLEAGARRQTRMHLRRQGDGTTRLSARIPDAAATRLATFLQAFTNPRKHGPALGQDSDSSSDPNSDPNSDPATGTTDLTDPLSRLPYPRRVGHAFCALLESLDPTRLPIHGGDATTVIVTLSLDQLRADLATADLLGGTLPGDGTDTDPTAGTITAAHARRLACTAQIIPAVLGGDSEVLDLGRARRLHTPAQRRAMLLRDRTCREQDCDVPGTWAEAHHWVPWSHGGHTTVEDGVLLCSHHHHRAHDPAYTAERLTNGDVRFHRRR